MFENVRYRVFYIGLRARKVMSCVPKSNASEGSGVST